MIRVGIAGLGFMGMVHYLSYQKIRGVKVAAICEKNRKRLEGDWRGIQGNFGPAGTRMDLSGVATYENLDDMLADDSLDLIDVTLPPSLHAGVAVAALKHSKHVFCEKPMALEPRDCRKMNAAAQKADRRLLIGHVLPFFPEYAWALKAVQSRRYGKLLGGEFRRVISDPSWLAHYWKLNVIGGPMLDLHVHDAHFIRLLFGMPRSVHTAGRMRGDLCEHWHTLFDYPDASVAATSGTIEQQGRSFDHGFELQLEKATLAFRFAVSGGDGRYLCEPTVYDSKGKTKPAKLAGGDPMDAFAAELRHVARCVRTGEDAGPLESAAAEDAILLCQKQTQSLTKGKPVKVVS
ncbi:MAG: Gfo/Idh/MocA family oxidoreductase [Planctomycetota bacterium]